MPKDLFFTLSAEKQTRVSEAALKEFSKEKYHDASINQIIKTANISRGSFYQYFIDKEDLFFYILENIIESTAYPFIQKFIKTKPTNVFSIYRELLIYNLKMVSNEKYKAFFSNMYLSMNYQLQEKMKKILYKKRSDLLLNMAREMIKELGYEEEYFIELMNIMEIINRDLLTMKIGKGLSDEEILQIFDLRMKIMWNVKP